MLQIKNLSKIYKEKGKEMKIEIVDKDLIELTNGIVQGLSGTPIIQNGKVVGAITHVFVQDSKMGYATFIENMMVVEWNFNEAGLGICEKKVVQNNLENALLGNICKK